MVEQRQTTIGSERPIQQNRITLSAALGGERNPTVVTSRGVGQELTGGVVFDIRPVKQIRAGYKVHETIPTASFQPDGATTAHTLPSDHHRGAISRTGIGLGTVAALVGGGLFSMGADTQCGGPGGIQDQQQQQRIQDLQKGDNGQVSPQEQDRQMRIKNGWEKP